nr:MAG TPA: hypothetical protein [Caudoviricetes sp.]
MLLQSGLRQHYFWGLRNISCGCPPLLWQFPSHVRLHNKPSAKIICF